MAGISELKTALNNHGGISRLCKYNVDFSGWGARVPFNDKNLRDLDYFLEGVTIPGRTISAVKYSLWDKPIDMPTGYENQELTLDFLMPNDHYIRNLFYQWHHNIINTKTQLINYRNEYVTDMNIFILNDWNTNGYQVQLTEAYPLSYNSYAFSASSTEYAKLSVTFAYNKMTEKSKQVASSLNQAIKKDGAATPNNAQKSALAFGDEGVTNPFTSRYDTDDDGLGIPTNIPAPYDSLKKKFDERIAVPSDEYGPLGDGIPRGQPLSNTPIPPEDKDPAEDLIITELPNGEAIQEDVINDPFIPTQTEVGSITQKSIDPVSGNVESQTDFNRGETTNVPGTSNLTRSQKDQKVYENLILGPNPEAGVTYARGRSWVVTADQWEGDSLPSDSFNNENEP